MVGWEKIGEGLWGGGGHLECLGGGERAFFWVCILGFHMAVM